jgi:hypothetical protein
MTIDDAIKALQQRKEDGVKAVLISWWEADKFDLPDDDTWRQAAEDTEYVMDWAMTHARLAALVKHRINRMAANKETSAE